MGACRGGLLRLVAVKAKLQPPYARNLCEPIAKAPGFMDRGVWSTRQIIEGRCLAGGLTHSSKVSNGKATLINGNSDLCSFGNRAD